MKRIILVIFISLSVYALHAQTTGNYYVDAGSGSDSNPGTIDHPFKSTQNVLITSGPKGGTIYLRVGTYFITPGLKPSYSGSKDSYHRLFAYPGEKIIIDCSQLSGSSNRIQLNYNFWHIKGIKIKNSHHNGINVAGSFNFIEDCKIHNNKNTGLNIGRADSYPLPSHNSILNCDSYFNYDPDKNGENADGFGIKYNTGNGNEFNGCRAYNNSDDGWDFWMPDSTVTSDSCFAFRNGIN